MDRYNYVKGVIGRPLKTDFESLRIVTCNLSELDLNYIEELVRQKISSSRSEYIRVAVRNQINQDLQVIKHQYEVIEDQKKLGKDFIRIPGYNGNKPVQILRRLE